MYFENFPKITYAFKVSDSNPDETIIVKDITQNVRFRKEVFDRVKFYDTYKIQDGDTPEIISEKIYGNPNYHWIIMLVNQRYDYIDDFAKDSYTIENTIQKKYGSHRNRTYNFKDVNGNVVNGTCLLTIAKPVIGTIRTTENKPEVYGTNTNFTKDLQVGNMLYTKENLFIGAIKTIISDSTLLLSENSSISYNDEYKCKLPLETGLASKSVIGSIKVELGSVIIKGSYTYFVKDIQVGNKILTNDNTLIGTVGKVIDDLTIELLRPSQFEYNDTYKCQVPLETGLVISCNTSLGYVTGYINAVIDDVTMNVVLTNMSFMKNDNIDIHRYGEDSNGNFTKELLGQARVISVEYPNDINPISFQDNEYTLNELGRELKIIPKADIDQILSEFTDLI